MQIHGGSKGTHPMNMNPSMPSLFIEKPPFGESFQGTESGAKAPEVP